MDRTSLQLPMEVVQVLRMNAGLGDTSYANNSLVQRKVISMTKSIAEAAISELYMTACPNDVLSMADLGCSSGPNAFLMAAELVKTVDKLCHKLGHRLPELQICLNDLPGNDFNSIFQCLLPRFQEDLNREIRAGSGPCFVSGVPGTFYGRLFPANSLHFVHSSYSLMWLSKVPDGVETNKENIYMTSTSPPSVINAYYQQFQRDFLMFLKCRAVEVVIGGKMVLTILGRKSPNPSSKEAGDIWELLAVALRQLVSEGRIEESKLHSFHIPEYMPSTGEVATQVEKEGSFAVGCLETSEIPWAACCGKGFDCEYDVAKCMRSVAEPLLAQHFGESIMDSLFERYRKVMEDYMAKEDPKFINVTVSMTRLSRTHDTTLYAIK